MRYSEVCPTCNYWRSDNCICKCGRLARRPYRRTLKERINRWCCQRLTGDPVHSFFWDWEIEWIRDSVFDLRISVGLITLWRHKWSGWEWAWNKD
jgi:hypothetical protein